MASQSRICLSSVASHIITCVPVELKYAFHNEDLLEKTTKTGRIVLLHIEAMVLVRKPRLRYDQVVIMRHLSVMSHICRPCYAILCRLKKESFVFYHSPVLGRAPSQTSPTHCLDEMRETKPLSFFLLWYFAWRLETALPPFYYNQNVL